MADETADISNQEQLVICIRWVDEELVVHEDFIGLRPVAETNASTITDAIKSILVEMNLDIMNARGQCYDGASTMRGHRTGVVPAIKSINEKCLYTHCYGHALNLAVSDAIKGVKVLSDAFDTVKEICKLVKKSLQRDTHLKFVKTSRENEAKSVHAFCPTRWTVRAETCQSILENHSELLELWEWSLEKLKDVDMKARIRGVQVMMVRFDFFFACSVSSILLRNTDQLAQTLQDPKISAAEGNNLAQMVIKTLRKDRTDEHFDLFWIGLCSAKINKECQILNCHVKGRPLQGLNWAPGSIITLHKRRRTTTEEFIFKFTTLPSNRLRKDLTSLISKFTGIYKIS